MTHSLAPCPSCSRHVRTSEASCPFCKAALAPGELAASVIPAASTRLTRAAAFAFTASLAVAGCTGGSTLDTDGGTEGGTDGGTKADSSAKDASVPDEGGIAPPYGVPAYGAPAPFDAGGD
jgi:hypothetical protein